jgi:hypothetical protein
MSRAWARYQSSRVKTLPPARSFHLRILGPKLSHLPHSPHSLCVPRSRFRWADNTDRVRTISAIWGEIPHLPLNFFITASQDQNYHIYLTHHTPFASSDLGFSGRAILIACGRYRRFGVRYPTRHSIFSFQHPRTKTTTSASPTTLPLRPPTLVSVGGQY